MLILCCVVLLAAQLLFTAPKLLLTEAERVRLDEAPDSVFYATPRMMQHAAAEDLEALAGTC